MTGWEVTEVPTYRCLPIPAEGDDEYTIIICESFASGTKKK